jgi:hypothetical protein
MATSPEPTLPKIPDFEGDLDLSKDDQSVLQRELREQIFGFGHLVNLLVENKPVAKNLAHSILYMAESRVAQICKLTGIELDSATDREQRYARIRGLNARVRDLERELGQGGTVEQTKAHLKNASDILNKWWDDRGFGHISDIRFSPYGSLEAKFSCSLFGAFRLTKSDTPVSDVENKKLWYQSLRERGFKLTEIPQEREPSLEDCDQNRAALTNLFTSNLPSSVLLESTNHFDRRGGVMLLRDVHVMIYNLQDIFDLETSASTAN